MYIHMYIYTDTRAQVCVQAHRYSPARPQTPGHRMFATLVITSEHRAQGHRVGGYVGGWAFKWVRFQLLTAAKVGQNVNLSARFVLSPVKRLDRAGHVIGFSLDSTCAKMSKCTASFLVYFPAATPVFFFFFFLPLTPISIRIRIWILVTDSNCDSDSDFDSDAPTIQVTVKTGNTA